MSIPVVTCGPNQNKNYSGSGQTINLFASASADPDLYTWTMKDVPPGSNADIGVNGDFTNGVTNVQNPTFLTTAAIEGAYVCECIATNDEGNNDPYVDRESCQTIVYVLTEFASKKLPGDYQFSYGDDLNETIKSLINKRLDELNIPTDNTNLDSSQSRHGLFKKLSGSVNDFCNGVGDWIDLTIENGFLFTDDTECTLSFDNPTRTFSVTPVGASFTFWSNKKKYIKTVKQDVIIPPAEALYYFYFDSSGDLQYTTTWTDDLITIEALVSNAYWDNDNNVAYGPANERHARKMSGETHKWAHHGIRTVYKSGLGFANFNIGNGSANEHAQFSVGDGVILDEDIEHKIINGSPQTLSPIAQIPLFYRLGVGGLWRGILPTDYAVTTLGTLAAWNEEVGGVFQLSTAPNNRYVLTHIYATGGVTISIVGIVGQSLYLSKKDAQEGATLEINQLSLGTLTEIFKEFKALGTIIWKTSNGMSNAVKSAIEQTSDSPPKNYVDFRQSGAGPGSGVTTSDHDTLAHNGGVGSHAIIQAFMDILTTKGDILTRNSTDIVRKAVGGNGTIIVGDDTEDVGWKWGSLGKVEQFLSTNRTIVATSLSPIPTEPMTKDFYAKINQIVLVGYSCRITTTIDSPCCKMQLRLDTVFVGDFLEKNISIAQFETNFQFFPVQVTSTGTHTIELYASTDILSWNILSGAHLYVAVIG